MGSDPLCRQICCGLMRSSLELVVGWGGQGGVCSRGPQGNKAFFKQDQGVIVRK